MSETTRRDDDLEPTVERPLETPRDAPRISPRYRVVGYVGRGGMGAVYRVLDLELGEVVALKVLGQNLRADPESLTMFREEARLARRVTHRNVVRIHDIGDHEGERFLTMEHIEGESLRTFAARHAPLDVREVARIGAAIAAGLHAIHDAGIVHRDLKPENILLETSGRVAISDFGIARMMNRDATGDRALGTPAYMAPEQLAKAVVDARADVYALGAVLFELATGRRPWEGADVLRRKTEGPTPDPRAVVPSLPDAFCSLVVRCLARSPDGRPRSAREVEEALTAAVAPPSSPPPLNRIRSWSAEKHVAVLPLSCESAPDDRYLAIGIASELADALATVPGVRVRPMGLVGSAITPERRAVDVGRAIGADVVVDGVISRGDESVDVVLRMTVVDDGLCLWTERFENAAMRASHVIRTAQNAIGNALAARAHAASIAPPSDPITHDLYLRGRFASARDWHEALEPAVRLLGEAHARAPNDARIAATYALALARQFGLRSLSVEACEKARRVARHAIAIEPSGAAHVALALTHWYSGEGSSTASELRLALEQRPVAVEALDWTAQVLIEVGATDLGLRFLDRALALEPQLGRMRNHRARILALRGDFDGALAELDRVVGDELDVATAAALRARILAWQPDLRLVERELEMLPHRRMPAPPRAIAERYLRITLRRSVTEEEEAAMTRSTPAQPSPRRAAFFMQLRAELYAVVGNRARVLETLEALDDGYFLDVGWLEACPLLDGFREHAEYTRLLERTRRRGKPILELLGGLSVPDT